MKLWILNFLYRCFIPDHWIKLPEYDRKGDEFLLECIEKGYKPSITEYSFARLSIGGKNVWILNYPYAFGGVYDTKDEYLTETGNKKRCGSYVAVKFKKYLKKHGFLTVR